MIYLSFPRSFTPRANRGRESKGAIASESMNLEVLFFGKFREITGVSRMSAVVKDGARLADLVDYLTGQYGDEIRKNIEDIPGLRILVNGREYYLLGRLEAPLAEGNTIVFLPPIAGG